MGTAEELYREWQRIIDSIPLLEGEEMSLLTAEDEYRKRFAAGTDIRTQHSAGSPEDDASARNEKT